MAGLSKKDRQSPKEDEIRDILRDGVFGKSVDKEGSVSTTIEEGDIEISDTGGMIKLGLVGVDASHQLIVEIQRIINDKLDEDVTLTKFPLKEDELVVQYKATVDEPL